MKDVILHVLISILLVISLLVLHSIAPFVFPIYFVYIVVAVAGFLFFSQIDFEALSLFNTIFYIGSIILLILPLIIGQVTRGTVRWIPLGPVAIQPAEIVRPFLFIFFAVQLAGRNITLKHFVKVNFLFLIPFILIVIQPSLGVGIMTALGYLGIVLASTFSKRKLLIFLLSGVVLLPLLWQFLAPYQKDRILSFTSTESNYNSIQSMIAVGSGKLTGHGLGKGVETQLAFLPEKHTDFIFASIAEELGFIGASIVLVVIFVLLYRIVKVIESSVSPTARMFVSGVFLMFLAQIIVHVGMNMGMLPITGLPLPLVSYGGSSLVATMITLGMVIGAKK